MRSIGVERVYPLGDYKNIKITSYISDISDTVSEEEYHKLRVLQLIDLDIYYREYIALNKKLHGLSLEDSLILLDKMKEGLETEILEDNPVQDLQIEEQKLGE